MVTRHAAPHSALDVIRWCPVRHELGEQVTARLHRHVLANTWANSWLFGVLFDDGYESVFVWDNQRGMTDFSAVPAPPHPRIDVRDNQYLLDGHFAEYSVHLGEYIILARQLS